MQLWSELRRGGPLAAVLVVLGLASSSNAAVIPGQVIIADGDAPNGTTQTVSDIRPPFVNGLGDVGFIAFLTNSEVAVMRNADALWLNSSAAGSVLTGAQSAMGIGNAGEFAYRTSDDGEQAVWTQNGLLLRASEAAPGLPDGTVTTSHRSVAMTPGGAVYWVAGFNTSGETTEQGRVFYSSSDATVGNISVVLSTGDTIGPDTIVAPDGLSGTFSVSDDGAHQIHVIFTDADAPALGAVLFDGAIVAQDGDATGGGDNWDSFDLVSANTLGNHVFSGDTDGATATDEFIAYNATIAVREGDTLDGETLDSGSSVRFLGINNFNQAMFSWSDGAITREHLFWACDASDIPGSVQRVLTTDEDELDIDGDGVGDYTITDILAGTNAPTNRSAEDYSVFLEAQLDGTTDAMIRIPVTCCGNAIDDPLEECDDGNDVNTDDCIDTCETASCGDGHVWENNEACDDGNDDNSDACIDTCEVASCGDGHQFIGMEECDDANDDNTDECLDNCMQATCGDGFVHDGVEECDDMNFDATDACTTQCLDAVCGDGFVWAINEECDDGNDDDDDACGNDCMLNDVGTTGTGGVSAGTDSDGTDASGTDSGGTDSGGTDSGDSDGATSTSAGTTSTTGASGSASASGTATASTSLSTGSPTDTDSDSDGDSAGALDDDGCGCRSTGPAPGWAWLGLLGLLGLRRRRASN